MKKHFLFLAMSLVAALSFASCDKDEKEESSNGDENQISSNHEYVDLGLPSGTLWATCNIGAEIPEDFGDYFAWGETDPNADGYKFRVEGEASDSMSRYNRADNLRKLLPEDDAATVNWGKEWRMPTQEDFEELSANCEFKWITINGIIGAKLTAKNGNYIFFPPAGRGDDYGSGTVYVGTSGFYWSSSFYSCARYFYTNSKTAGYSDCGNRQYRSTKMPIRPVRSGK